MNCPGGFNILHPLWAAWEREWLTTKSPWSVWDRIRLTTMEEPQVPQWIPCPGDNCGHPEDPLVALAP